MSATAEHLTGESTVESRSDARSLKPSVVVWTALVVFTLASFALGGEHLIEDDTIAAAVVVGIAAVKIRLVGIHFMELRDAPLVLRGFFEVYCALLFVVIMGIHLIA
jgi:heme/copper-type cytochrome/quinol oxidase subunit 4